MASPAFASDIAGRLSDVTGRIASAATRAGRAPASVALLAVSKGFGVDAIAAACDAGQLDFGENRVQELRRKAAELSGVRWHFVGRLQRNKVRDVVGSASLIHSVDRLELARDIAEQARVQQRLQRVLVQVNAGDDPAKAGCALDQAPALVGAVRDMDGLACEGLMTIPPLGEDPRPTFARLRQLRDDLHADFPEVRHLSMGMTNDFEVAVEEGATIVRVGEAVFGPRPEMQLRPPQGGSSDRPSVQPAGQT
jgi:pyridoxal phosphate enzyme (YggS family)